MIELQNSIVRVQAEGSYIIFHVIGSKRNRFPTWYHNKRKEETTIAWISDVAHRYAKRATMHKCQCQHKPVHRVLSHKILEMPQGYAVGNGCTDEVFDSNAIVSFIHGMGLITKDIFEVSLFLNFGCTHVCLLQDGNLRREWFTDTRFCLPYLYLLL